MKFMLENGYTSAQNKTLQLEISTFCLCPLCVSLYKQKTNNGGRIVAFHSVRAVCGYFQPCFSSTVIVPIQKVQLLERMPCFLPLSSPADRILTNRTRHEKCCVNWFTYSSYTIHTVKNHPEFKNNRQWVFEAYTVRGVQTQPHLWGKTCCQSRSGDVIHLSWTAHNLTHALFGMVTVDKVACPHKGNLS